ncbi:MAG: 50S ribosomal protein L15e [Candidatus Micrarchaeota archaeon]
MGAYKYIKKNFEREYHEKNPLYKQRMIEWRNGNAIERVGYPINLARARTLGYKAKNGYITVRVRIRRGKRKRQKPFGGRKPKHNYRFVQSQLSLQALCEQRAARIYKNLEVLNSYWIGEDGNYKFFEIILVDPTIVKDIPISRLHIRGRAFRGLTSQGKKARSLRAIGKRKQRAF